MGPWHTGRGAGRHCQPMVGARFRVPRRSLCAPGVGCWSSTPPPLSMSPPSPARSSALEMAPNILALPAGRSSRRLVTKRVVIPGHRPRREKAQKTLAGCQTPDKKPWLQPGTSTPLPGARGVGGRSTHLLGQCVPATTPQRISSAAAAQSPGPGKGATPRPGALVAIPRLQRGTQRLADDAVRERVVKLEMSKVRAWPGGMSLGPAPLPSFPPPLHARAGTEAGQRAPRRFSKRSLQTL